MIIAWNIKQQQVACLSALLPWQDLHLAIEFQRPLPQPFFWLLLVLPALLISFNQTTNQHFETSACLPSTICCRKSWHNYIFRTWTRFNVWGPPFPSKDKVFSTNHVKKMCQGRNGHQQQGHQSDIYDKSLQQPLPPPLYAAPQALPTEEASSQTCADPRQPSMYPICFNNLHTKNGMREIGSHNWHFSWFVPATTSRMSVCTATVAGLASGNWISKASSSALLLDSACLACTFNQTNNLWNICMLAFHNMLSEKLTQLYIPYITTFQHMRAPLSF